MYCLLPCSRLLISKTFSWIWSCFFTVILVTDRSSALGAVTVDENACVLYTMRYTVKSAYMQSLACMINSMQLAAAAACALGEALRMSVSKRFQLNATNNNGDIVVDDEELGGRAVLHKVLPQRQTETAAAAFINVETLRGVVDSLQCQSDERMSMTNVSNLEFTAVGSRHRH